MTYPRWRFTELGRHVCHHCGEPTRTAWVLDMSPVLRTTTLCKPCVQLVIEGEVRLNPETARLSSSSASRR